jgi:hypothetical protein
MGIVRYLAGANPFVMAQWSWRVGAAPRGSIFTMADRYQDRPFPPDADHDRNASAFVRGESEPLAELAQLIGQTDPSGSPTKPVLPLQSRANVRPQYARAEKEVSAPARPLPWRQRVSQEAPPQQEYEEPEPGYRRSPGHPLGRYAAPPAAASEQDHHEPQQIRREGKCWRSGLSGRS